MCMYVCLILHWMRSRCMGEAGPDGQVGSRSKCNSNNDKVMDRQEGASYDLDFASSD